MQANIRSVAIMKAQPLTSHADRYPARLDAARRAAESAGTALITLRGARILGREAPGGQLKTAVDQAAEGWVVGYLRALFPEDSFLCEELFEQATLKWDAPRAYWTIDALDGTRSFVEGFDGFCVQVAYIQDGQVQLGVVHEPVRQVTYWALAGEGAFVQTSPVSDYRMVLQAARSWPTHPIFVDSTRPTGIVRNMLTQTSGEFLECGSFGLKICRVADGSADLFIKEVTYKLWDVAPGALILHEAGGRLGLWTGETIPFNTKQVYFENLLAAPSGLFELVIEELVRGDVPGQAPQEHKKDARC